MMANTSCERPIPALRATFPLAGKGKESSSGILPSGKEGNEHAPTSADR
jgi:hypothetical protein